MKRSCHLTWLIFDGKILRNTACFARLHTRQVSTIAKHLSFLYFSRQNAEKKFQLKSTILFDKAPVLIDSL